MKQKSFYSLLLAGVITLVAGLFSGCTEEEPEMYTTQRIVINYTDSVVDASISPEAKTRSQSVCPTPAGGVLTSKSGKKLYFRCTETAWPSDKTAKTRGTKVTTAGISNLGVSASVYPAANTYTSACCGSYFYKESVSSGTPMSYYWPTSDYKISFFGYYPYNNASFTVQSAANVTGAPTYAYTVPSSIASQQDIMTGQVTDQSGGSSSPVNMTLAHRCSAIHFSITNDRSDAITVNSISIEGVKYTGTLSGSTWTLGGSVNSSSTNPFTLTYDSSVAAGATVDITGTSNIFMMLPQTLTSSAKLKMVIDSEVFEAELSGSWQAGKEYTYSVTKEPEDDTSIDLGLPSGTLWAKGNIVSDGNGGYKIGDETDCGAYFSWGNVDPHFSSDGSTFDDSYNWGESSVDTPYSGSAGSSISTTGTGRLYTANTTNDAARACLGGSWQVPTATQFKELYDNTDNQWSAISGVYGRKFMKKTDHSVYVFFPAAGYGRSTSLYNRGLFGYYWSSSKGPADFGYTFYFDSSNVLSQSFNSQYFGCSVRAVQ